MNTFANAVINQETTTTNGMKARKSTANALVDFFFKAGASRGKNIIPEFTAAFVEDKELALRIVQWMRDVRGGAGERALFRNILRHLETTDKEAASLLMFKIPEIGRWDDVFCFADPELKAQAFNMVKYALESGNGLCAKWCPRKGDVAIELRKFMNISPKQYRKLIVSLTSVVESKMCSREWNDIDFNKLPSLASARYRNAFKRNSTKYAEYVENLSKGTSKVSTAAVYPYDVIKSAIRYMYSLNKLEKDFIIAQWNALPNFVGDANIFPVIDVSGSMQCTAGNKGTVTCLEAAVSLGLYLADKNTGAFKDVFCTFSSNPEIVQLKGTVIDKITQMSRANWGMSTDLCKTMDAILKVAVDGNVPESEMPKAILICSDMQFNTCVTFNDSAIESIRRKFEAAGYTVPNVVFWNLKSHNNVPVKFDERGTALISGFSPAILKSVLSGNMDEMTPEAIMMKAIMNERYNIG